MSEKEKTLERIDDLVAHIRKQENISIYDYKHHLLTIVDIIKEIVENV